MKFNKKKTAVSLVDHLASSKTKEPSRKPLTSTTSAPTKPTKSRTSCAKREKVHSGGKKKKGKKKQVAAAENPAEEETTQVAVQQDDAPTVPVDGAEPHPVLVDGTVPDLPSVCVPDPESETGSKKRRKGNKQLIAPSKPVERTKFLNETTEAAQGYYNFGDLGASKSHLEEVSADKPAKVPSYLTDRMVLSQQSSRFELPMDMKSLEKMSPSDYLREFCIISTRRKSLYGKIFQKHRARSGTILGKSTLCRALQEVLVNAMKPQQLTDLCDILDIEEETTVDLKLFSGMSALAERILYPEYLTEDTAECSEYHREKVECADFCSLQWKLHGVNISPPVKKILEALG